MLAHFSHYYLADWIKLTIFALLKSANSGKNKEWCDGDKKRQIS